VYKVTLKRLLKPLKRNILKLDVITMIFKFFQKSKLSSYGFTLCKGVVVFAVLFTIYFVINVRVTGSFNSYVSTKSHHCYNSKEDADDLLYLIQVTHKILNKYELDPFLCYGSLWGALRLNNPLPWDYDFDVGILYDDIQKVNTDDIQNDFRKAGIEFFYQRWSGNYKVKKGKMTGDLMLYVKQRGMIHRIGIESWLCFVHYRYYHIFPLRLIEKPLPKLQFGNVAYSVPREGIELQKYLYPSSWKKVVSPKGCNYTYPKHVMESAALY